MTAASRLARLRRLWLDVHLWIGVGLMVLLIPVAVSGAALVWHDAMDRALHAERYRVSGADAGRTPGAYAAAAEAAFAGRATLTQLRWPQASGDPVVAVGRIAGPPGPGGRPRTLNAWIDPPTGRVLAVGEVAKSFTMTLHRLHGTLLVPGVGRKLVGWLGWAMFVSSATGLWLWWPRHGGVLKALRWRRGASQLFNLHHTVGVWLCLPLAVLSLSGVYISFPQTARAMFGVAAPSGATSRGDARFAPPLARPNLSVDQAVGAAKTAAAGRLSAITLPQVGRRPAWRVEFQPAAGEAARQVRVDDATGAARVGGDRAPVAGGPDALSRWMRRVHDGTGMGLAWRLIITLAGAAPLALGVSGLVMWLRRRARRLALAAA